MTDPPASAEQVNGLAQALKAPAEKANGLEARLPVEGGTPRR
jgi:hypothetical protein